jgi:hypothetical protein
VVCPLYNKFCFSLYLINGTILEKQKLLNTKYVYRVPLQSVSEAFFITGRTERDMIKNVHWSPCKVPLFLPNFNETLNFLDEFFKNYQISNFMKIRSVVAELFHADRRTDITKLIVVFRNIANVPNKFYTEFRIEIIHTFKAEQEPNNFSISTRSSE